MSDWRDSQQPFDMPENGMGQAPDWRGETEANVSITVSGRRPAPVSLTVSPEVNLFTRHCAVVKCEDIIPGRRLREIPAPFPSADGTGVCPRFSHAIRGETEANLSGPPPGGPTGK